MLSVKSVVKKSRIAWFKEEKDIQHSTFNTEAELRLADGAVGEREFHLIREIRVIRGHHSPHAVVVQGSVLNIDTNGE